MPVRLQSKVSQNPALRMSCGLRFNASLPLSKESNATDLAPVHANKPQTTHTIKLAPTDPASANTTPGEELYNVNSFRQWFAALTKCLNLFVRQLRAQYLLIVVKSASSAS